MNVVSHYESMVAAYGNSWKQIHQSVGSLVPDLAKLASEAFSVYLKIKYGDRSDMPDSDKGFVKRMEFYKSI